MSSKSPVKARGGGYGLDAELAKKAAEKYDYDLEDEARAWIEEITKEEIGEDFGLGLKDGQLLCKLINAIKPGVIRKIETSKMPFKQMENISTFLRTIRKFGVMEHDCFETVDLFEQKDLGVVVLCLHALGRAVQKNIPEFEGPTLGVKESTANKRSFTPAQLAQGKSFASKIHQGSSKTMQRAYIRSTSNIAGDLGTMEKQTSPPVSPPAPPAPPAPRALSTPCAPPPVPPARPITPVPISRGSPPPLPPARSPPPVKELENLEMDPTSSLPSLDRRSPEVNSSPDCPKSETKIDPVDRYDYEAEEEAQEWIEAVVGESFPSESFGECLKDGVILCKLMNKIKPGAIRRIETSKMPFKQMENISNFIKACRVVGVQEFDLFETVDLFEQKNIGNVVRCLHALGRTIQKYMPNFEGPSLGVKESSINVRSFTPEQLQEAAGSASKLSLGSSQVMDRGGFDRSISITFGADASTSKEHELNEISL